MADNQNMTPEQIEKQNRMAEAVRRLLAEILADYPPHQHAEVRRKLLAVITKEQAEEDK
jgi:DNA-binding MarR family transcriptional regulator